MNKNICKAFQWLYLKKVVSKKIVCKESYLSKWGSQLYILLDAEKSRHLQMMNTLLVAHIGSDAKIRHNTIVNNNTATIAQLKHTDTGDQISFI